MGIQPSAALGDVAAGRRARAAPPGAGERTLALPV